MVTPTRKIEVGKVELLFPQFDLFKEHWHEVAKNKHLMLIAPDFEKYKLIQEAGKLLCVIAYEDEEIVGYSINIMDVHLHYRFLKVCINDIIFVKKDKRQSPLGLRLKNFTEELAKENGCKMMLWPTKEGSVFDEILIKQGYPIQDIVRCKEL